MQGQALENAVTAMRLGMLITSFIALLVGVYIIFNSFTIAVNQRWKEIGILRAVGRGAAQHQRDVPGRSAVHGRGRLLRRGLSPGYYLAAGANQGDGLHRSFGLRNRLHRRGAETPCGPGADVVWRWGVAASLVGAWFPARAASYLDPDPGAAQH